MRFTQGELLAVVGVIVYVAFFTHPPPAFVMNVVGNPVGQALCLLGILYVSMRISHVIALLLAIAFLVSVNPVLEYLDEKEQKPAQKKSAAVPAPPIGDLLQKLMKGDRLPQKAGKDVGKKHESVVPPKPSPVGKEHFAAF